MKNKYILIFIFSLSIIFSFSNCFASDFSLKNAEESVELQKLIDPEMTSEKLIWLGGDAATSVEVTPDMFIWIFGDTLIGKSENYKRDYSIFIHNSIGVAEKQQGEFGVINKYYNEENSEIEEIFPCENSSEFYWPIVGVFLENYLLVSANIITTENTDIFEIKGSAFFLVENPEVPPDEWKYKSSDLLKKDEIVWGTAFARENDYIYIFGQKGSGYNSSNVLSKINISEAEKGNWHNMEFIGEIEGLPGASEMTVQYSAFFKWYCLQIPPLTYDVHLYVCDSINGKWEDKGIVYEIPEPWSSEQTSDCEPIFITYAVKSHLELTKNPNQIVITYNINLDPFIKGLTDKLSEYMMNEKYKDLYIPQFVLLEFDKQ